MFMKRGGIWQRRAAERDNEAASSSGTKRCNLADLLIEEWGFGRMSAPMVQRIAAAAYSDGLGQVQRLASIGSWGAYPNNTHRDLVKIAQCSPVASCWTDVRLTLRGTLLNAELSSSFL